MKACTTTEAIRFLLSRARPMTDDERHRQMVSLAYGNAAMENPAVTRGMFEREMRKAPRGRAPGKGGGR